MAPKASAKPRRHKKRKSRTEVSSDSSDSEAERSRNQVKSKASTPGARESSSSSVEESTNREPTSSREPKDADIETAFAKFYMQHVTAEFADDLEKLRTSDDFKDEAVPMLIAALKGGTAMFSKEEKMRIVIAGREKDA